MKILKVALIAVTVLAVLGGAVIGAVNHMLIYPAPLISGDGERRIVCVGDSLTFAQGVLGSRKTDSFSAILSTLVEDSTVVNYGLSNRTLQSTGNLPYTNEDNYAKSLAEDADVVIIMLGSNDTKPLYWNAERFTEEYRAFIRSYMEMASSPKVYIMIPTAIFLAQDGETCDDSTVRGELSDIVRALGEELGVKVIDLYAVTDGHAEWFPDGLHPNAEGNRAMAEEIAKYIKK